MSDPTAKRLYIIEFLIFLFAILILGKIFIIQVVESDNYKAQADNQYVTAQNPQYNRGTIYFKEKNGTLISAATIKNGYFVAINPKIIEDAELAFNKINKLVKLDREDFFKKVDKKDDPFEEIISRLSVKDADKIKELNIKGVGVYPRSWRFYPGESLGAHFLGFVGFKGNYLFGQYGLEKYYEDTLKREKTSDTNINSFAEVFLDYGKNLFSSMDNPIKGDLVLTIEPQVQAQLEDALLKINEKWGSKFAGGIIMDPKTGKIIAMSAKPDFNPNIYRETESLSLFINPNVENIFEFGSIMKPLTIAMGLNDKVLSAKTTYFDKGYLILNGRKIENYDGIGRGEVTMQEVLNQSLNTGAVFAGKKVGKEKFYKYILDLGFSERTGIDLPGEVKGLTSNLKSNRDIEYATASFGQGVATTPIAMASALATLSNGGDLVKPYIVDKVITQEGESRETKTIVRRKVFTKETSERISRMLTETVDKALLGGTVKLKNYSVAAKTGTAQLAKTDEAGYEEGKYLHSFFGYAPAFDPEFLIFLYVKEPIGARYASETLTHPFINLTKFLLNYYEIPPDR